MEENLKSKAIKNSFWNVVASLTNKIGAFIFTIILARFLAPERLGIFSLATALALFLLTFTDLGLNQAAIRFVSANLKKEKKKNYPTRRTVVPVSGASPTREGSWHPSRP